MNHLHFASAMAVLSEFEDMLFNDLAFSEKTVREELESRKASDSLSSAGSKGQTNRFAEKKQVYLGQFQKNEQGIGAAVNLLNQLQIANPDNASILNAIPRFEKCLNQINKLRGIVMEF
ncbi:MAG: hypothetical protein FWH10_07590 [Oscillospiraceae bacterium]|nr:hypothetical protein [Oscillospiraceae bacterium]